MLIINRNSWSIFEGNFKDTRAENEKDIIPAPEQYDFDSFRKPGIGMIEYFRFTHDKPTEELFIGDMKSDQECAFNAQIEFLWAHTWRKEYWIV